MTRTDLLTQWSYRLNKTPPPNLDATTEARALGFFNQRQRRLLTLPGLRHLREATITFSSAIDQAAYALSTSAKILRIWDPVNMRVLYEMSQQDLRLVDPVPISGTPEAFIWTGRQAVNSQPTVGALTAVSTNIADISQTVTVVGLLGNGRPRTEIVLLTGTTPAVFTQSGWARIDKFYLSAVCAGSVTLVDNSVTVLARTVPGHTQTHYDGFTLWPTPTGVIAYQVDIVRTTTDLLAATDEPLLPEDFHDVILLGAVMDEYQHVNDERYAVARSEYEQRVKEMQYWLAETAIGRPWSLTRGWQRPSQLGGWFPSGT